MRLWTKFKLALLAGLTVTMMWHWQVTEADAYVLEKSGGIPWAIVPGDALATPSGAEKAPMVEQVPTWTPEEHEILTRVLTGECQTGSWELQLAVGSVVLNRVNAPEYLRIRSMELCSSAGSMPASETETITGNRRKGTGRRRGIFWRTEARYRRT